MFVTSVSPNKLLAGQSAELTLQGDGFTGVVTAIVYGRYLPAFFRTETMVQFVLPSLPQGIFDIAVVNGDGGEWICRQALTISALPEAAGDLGSVELPLVLPPIIIESACSAVLNISPLYRDTESAAKVYSDPTTGETTAYLKLDSSVVPTEPVSRTPTVDNPSTGQVLDTPFGTFRN